MTRFGYGLAGIAVAALALAGLAWQRRSEPGPIAPQPPVEEAAAPRDAAKPVEAAPTLYCEFTNFADRNPRVGFYFAIQEGRQPPVYAQIFRRERDGSQDDFGQGGTARPEWSFDGSENPAVLRSPDDGLAINLYDYDPRKSGTHWFEAGLRSIRYLNLGGRCRRSTT